MRHDAGACACQTPGEPCDCVGDGCQPSTDCTGYACSDAYTCGAADLVFMARGTLCSDGAVCTFDDVCDGEGRCSGTLDHNLCSNFDICDGEELCDPADADRDVNGCVAGTPPNLSDGIECTVDSCRDGVIMHTPEGCAICETDRECQPEQGGVACLRYFCDEICMAQPRPQGTMCDDERSCTQTDACDANGLCVGADPSDALCNDQLWCDGIEICQPNHPNANADGCRPSVAPDPDDELPCTDDTCVECDPEDPRCDEGLEGELIHTPTLRCECLQDADCDEMADPCFVGTCTEGTYTCAIAPAEVDTPCNDGLACTDGDRCDADQHCVPQTDNCDCEVDADCTDDDDNVCLLSGACSEGVCQYTFASDGTACGDVACAAGSTCDGAGACDEVLDHDACTGPCRAAAMCDPDNGDADGCVYEPANDGACVVNCGDGDIEGACVVGVCQVPPEGPTGTQSCANEADDDCDGDVDNADSDCLTPDTVTVGGDDTGTVGAPSVLTIEAADGAQDATNQAGNLYCVGRVERYFEGFDSASVIENIDVDPNLAPIGTLGADVASGVTYAGATGMRICNGKGLLLGPFVQPSAAQELSLMLRIRMASMNPNGVGVNERFIVSYRNAVTGTEGEVELFVPTVGLDQFDDTLRDYQNVFYNAGGIGAVTVRLEMVSRDGGSDPNRCAFVDSVGMYAVPLYRAITDQVPGELTYLQWTWDGTTEDAEMEFEPGDGAEGNIVDSFFTQLPPGQDLRLEGRAKHTDAKGMQWDNGFQPGSIFLPPVTATPDDYDRSESVRLDWAMAMRNSASWGQGDAVDARFGVGNDPASYRKIGSAFPLDAPVQYVSQYYAGPNRDGSHKVRHRFVVELPEEMKPLLGRNLGFFRDVASAADASAYLDDIDLHTRHNDLYITFAPGGPQGYDSPVHEIALTSQVAGRVRVECYWQLPATADTPTIASAPHYLTISE